MDNATGSKWQACGRSKTTEFLLRGLLPAKQYTLRVCAVNRQGESDPVEIDISSEEREEKEDSRVRAT